MIKLLFKVPLPEYEKIEKRLVISNSGLIICRAGLFTDAQSNDPKQYILVYDTMKLFIRGRLHCNI